MNTINLLITNILFLLMALASHFDNRRPASTILRYKYQVKDNSIFRKIIRFKDKQFHPCNYFKIIPIYLFIFTSLISLIIFIIDLATHLFISHNYERALMIINGLIIIVSIVYCLIIIIWWESVDYKELKFQKSKEKTIKAARKTNDRIKNK